MRQITRIGLLLGILAAPAIADECSAGSLASMQGKTCDIGILTFDFGAVQAVASSYDNEDGAPLPTSLLLNPAEYEFTPLPTSQMAPGEAVTGFGITSLTGPQSLTSPPNGYSTALVTLGFTVVSRAGGIDSAAVGGSTMSLSGPGYGLSLIEASDSASDNRVFARDENGYCDTVSGLIPEGDIANGGSIVYELYNSDGGSGEWSGQSTTFSLFTETPAPEPSSLIALMTVSGLCGILLRRRFASRLGISHFSTHPRSRGR